MDNNKMNTLKDLFKNLDFQACLLAYLTALCIIYIVMSIFHPDTV